MIRVKYTTTSTGTSLTLSAATGFKAYSSTNTTLISTSDVIYMLVSEDGEDWEYGIGTLSGSTLTRNDYPWQSSAGGAGPGYAYQISLSAGTHTVFLTNEYVQGHVLFKRMKNTTGVSVSAGSFTTSLGTMSDDSDNLSTASGNADGSNSTILTNPASELAIARGFRIHFAAKCSSSGDGAGDMFGITLTRNDDGDRLCGAWGPLTGSEVTISCITPVFDMRGPFPDAYGKFNSGNYITYELWNTAPTSSITIKPYITIEWLL